MAKQFTAIACIVLIGATVLAVPKDSFEDSGEKVVQQNRQKRGGYIEKHAGYGASLGGMRVRGPAAVYTGATGGSRGMTYSTGSSSLYSYAPRRANAALYGGIHGPQTSEESLKFDVGMTRSMIADAMAARGISLYAGHGGVVPAAIQSRRNIQFYDVASNFDAAEPITVDVGQSPASQLNIRFRSSSSPLAVEQDHAPAPGSVRETSSEDEPHVLRHTVSRPIYQEVHEVIKPFRRVTQEIQPVQENVETVVARGDEISGGGISGTVLTADSGEIGGSAGFISGGGAGQGFVSGISAKQTGYGSGSYSSGLSQGGAIMKHKTYGTGVRHGSYSTMGGGGYPKNQYGHPDSMTQVQIPFARRAAGAARRA